MQADARSFDWNGTYVHGIEWKGVVVGGDGGGDGGAVLLLPHKEGFKTIMGPEDVTPGFIENAVRAEFAALELLGAHIFWLRSEAAGAERDRNNDSSTPFHEKRFVIVFPL